MDGQEALLEQLIVSFVCSGGTFLKNIDPVSPAKSPARNHFRKCPPMGQALGIFRWMRDRRSMAAHWGWEPAGGVRRTRSASLRARRNSTILAGGCRRSTDGWVK